MKRKMYEKPSVEVVVLKQAGMLKYTKGTAFYAEFQTLIDI